MQSEIEKKRPPQPRRLARAVKALRSPLTLIAVIGAGYLVLALMYVRENGKIGDLQYRADANQAALRRAPPRIDKYEADLAQAEATLESLKSSRVTTIPEEDLVQLTLQAASETGVTVTSAGTRTDTFVQKQGEKVRATPFFIRATGDLDQIQAFLKAMELGKVETLELQSSLITQEAGKNVLTLAAVIYSHLPLESPSDPGKGNTTPTAVPRTQKGN